MNLHRRRPSGPVILLWLAAVIVALFALTAWAQAQRAPTLAVFCSHAEVVANGAVMTRERGPQPFLFAVYRNDAMPDDVPSFPQVLVCQRTTTEGKP
jgi:hypothetical protein